MNDEHKTPQNSTDLAPAVSDLAPAVSDLAPAVSDLAPAVSDLGGQSLVAPTPRVEHLIDAQAAAPASPVIETVDVSEEARPTLAPIHTSTFRFCSNFAKIINAVDPKHHKKVLNAIASRTGITTNLLKGIYSGKFVPSVKEALKIAAVLNANVESIWFLMPPQSENK